MPQILWKRAYTNVRTAGPHHDLNMLVTSYAAREASQDLQDRLPRPPVVYTAEAKALLADFRGTPSWRTSSWASVSKARGDPTGLARPGDRTRLDGLERRGALT